MWTLKPDCASSPGIATNLRPAYLIYTEKIPGYAEMYKILSQKKENPRAVQCYSITEEFKLYFLTRLSSYSGWWNVVDDSVLSEKSNVTFRHVSNRDISVVIRAYSPSSWD